tara:strand:+ start:181 stop:726 length:546 start_codon:yes stop_codon:yes gene_type:complete
MVQYARPTGDKADDGSWSSTDGGGSPTYYTAIDETSASDSDYITGDGTSGSAVQIDFELTNGLTDPSVTTGHKIIFRYNTDGGSSDATLTARLMEGSTVRMSDAVDVSGVTSYTTRTYAPTNTTGSIGSYDNMFLRFIFEDADASDNVYISQAYVEVPDASGGGSDAVPVSLNTYRQMRER